MTWEEIDMVTEKVFGNLPSGEEAHLYHIENKSGAYIEVSQYGAILEIGRASCRERV